MMAPCVSPLTDDLLTEYWAHDLAPDGEAAVEADRSTVRVLRHLRNY